MAKKRIKNQKESPSKKGDENKIFAFLATFLTIAGFIIALIFKREDKYVMFYAKQGLVLFIASVIIALLSTIPIMEWFLLGPLLWIIWAVLWFMAWINSLSGKEKNLILVSEIADKLNL